VNLEKGRGFWGGLGLEKMKGKRSETMFVCFGSYDVLLLLLFRKCSNTDGRDMFHTLEIYCTSKNISLNIF
jgi:hypothetical protein